MPFEPTVGCASQPSRLVRQRPMKAEQETRPVQAESRGPEPLKRSGALGHSAEHRAQTVRLPSSCPFLHRAYQPCQPTFLQSVPRQAQPEADTRTPSAPVGKRRFPTAQSRRTAICERLSFEEMIVAIPNSGRGCRMVSHCAHKISDPIAAVLMVVADFALSPIGRLCERPPFAA